MTLRLEALVEQWTEERMLFVRELPGFVVAGRDTAELAARTGEALRHHLQWLVSRELIDEPEGEIDLQLTEELSSIGGSIGARFEADLIAPDEDEIEAALAVGRAALSDLIDAFDELPETVGIGTARLTLQHVASLDRWYASRLGVVSLDLVQPDPIDDLVSAAGTFEDAVDSLAESDLPDLIVIDGEDWTLAKALRRRTAHLREHLPELQSIESTE